MVRVGVDVGGGSVGVDVGSPTQPGGGEMRAD
jgi:hypothetical protein